MLLSRPEELRVAPPVRAAATPTLMPAPAPATMSTRTPIHLRLAQLAEQVRALQWRDEKAGICPTGLAALDAALGGGLAGGAVHELVIPCVGGRPAEGAAAHTLALRTAAIAAGGGMGEVADRGRSALLTEQWHAARSVSLTGQGHATGHTAGCTAGHRDIRVEEEGAGEAPARAWRWVLYVDTTLDFYPPGAAQIGVPLGRLLIVRTPRTADALWVGEQALRCRAIAAVVLPLRTVEAQATRRLQLAAEAGGGLGLVIRAEERGHTFAATRLRCVPVRGERGPRRVEVTILKLRGGGLREPVIVELPDAAHPVCASAVPVDGAGAERRRRGG